MTADRRRRRRRAGGGPAAMRAGLAAPAGACRRRRAARAPADRAAAHRGDLERVARRCARAARGRGRRRRPHRRGAARDAVARAGRVDVLVVNAGTNQPEPFLDVRGRPFDRLFAAQRPRRVLPRAGGRAGAAGGVLASLRLLADGARRRSTGRSTARPSTRSRSGRARGPLRPARADSSLARPCSERGHFGRTPRVVPCRRRVLERASTEEVAVACLWSRRSESRPATGAR